MLSRGFDLQLYAHKRLSDWHNHDGPFQELSLELYHTALD